VSESIDMPPGVEVALRSALGRVYDAGRKPDARARETAITYAINQVTHAWIMARLAQQPKAGG
jgi:hypothetical protein